MNFNDALQKAISLAQAALPDLQEDVFLVRDLHGRIRVLLQSADQGARPRKPFKDALKSLATNITADLGVYAYEKKDLFLFREDLQSLSISDAGSSKALAEASGFKVCLHDRLLIGTEWNASPTTEATDPRRFTLFSMKGGVGRSTTAAVLARHLATKGKRVLILDLDLESPGIGKTLLGDALPQFGIVDWFVEDALGQAAQVLPDMVAESAIGQGTNGRVAVVPAFGADAGDYLSKLGRAYLERGPNGHEAWSERLKRLVKALEDQETPNVVLLDSRTGLHDTSAALVLAMGAETLCFAVDTPQTWAAYSFLFRHWQEYHPQVEAFRDKLWILGAMVPDKQTDPYVDGLRQRAWDLFREHLYDELDPANTSAFSFAETDDAGNHFPREIYWNDGLVAFDPLVEFREQWVTAAYQSFLDWFDQVMLPEPAAT